MSDLVLATRHEFSVATPTHSHSREITHPWLSKTRRHQPFTHNRSASMASGHTRLPWDGEWHSGCEIILLASTALICCFFLVVLPRDSGPARRSSRARGGCTLAQTLDRISRTTGQRARLLPPSTPLARRAGGSGSALPGP
jgi:hypothetical protein